MREANTLASDMHAATRLEKFENIATAEQTNSDHPAQREDQCLFGFKPRMSNQLNQLA